MRIQQLRSVDETGTLSYFIYDEITGTSLIIDPNINDLKAIHDIIENNSLLLKYIIDTHTHADHISAAGELKKVYDSKLIMHESTKSKWKVVDEGDKFGIGDILRANAKFDVDIYVNDGDSLQIDSLNIKFLHTPGHTDNHLSVLIDDAVFTGDLLLIGQAGRSDLPGGNASDQYKSLTNKILNLPDNTKIYPGHDYEENVFSYLKNEKESNPFLRTKNENEYIEFVKDFFPPFSEATNDGKTTLQCGTKRVNTNKKELFETITPKELAKMMKEKDSLFILDVRESYELKAFGAIPGVKNISIRELTSRLAELPSKNSNIVVVCQSGNRSYEASNYLARNGYENIYNLDGGTMNWLYSNEPEVKSIMQESI